jgi:hypothetical protein
MRRALTMMSETDLDVRLVSYGRPSEVMLQIARDFRRDTVRRRRQDTLIHAG